MELMEIVEVTTKSPGETKKLARIFAKEILKTPIAKRAVVIGLAGELGGGKTTFTQGFARGLGIKHHITSPTFVLMRSYQLPVTDYRLLIHIDAYRIAEPRELLLLGWKELLQNPYNIIIVEWADRIKSILPRSYIEVRFNIVGEKERGLKFKVKK